MNKKYYGTTRDGRTISMYTISNNTGMEADFLDFGAVWESMRIPCADGTVRDVVLGHETLAGYEANGEVFGAIVGRVANRTEKGRFVLDGVEYQLEINDGENNLHSSHEKGFHKQLWDVKELTGNSITFAYFSPDGECGFPGNMDVQVKYTLTDEGEIIITYNAICDKRSIINLTNHSYFNLNGHNSGDARGQLLQIEADSYTPIKPGGIPTGEIATVEGTPFDFREMKPIIRDFNEDCQQLHVAAGYDHNFVIRGSQRELRKAAEAVCEESGITMEVYLDQPGMQLYTGNFIGKKTGKGGSALDKYSGYCLETHGFTNAINTPGFPSPIIEADEPYETITIFKFSTK
ncbi:MAG: galactose mutarotase [Eubacterium sp.]|nr:galactose mutarotase [Candidatus Colimonas fimequi]